MSEKLQAEADHRLKEDLEKLDNELEFAFRNGETCRATIERLMEGAKYLWACEYEYKSNAEIFRKYNYIYVCYANIIEEIKSEGIDCLIDKGMRERLIDLGLL